MSVYGRPLRVRRRVVESRGRSCEVWMTGGFGRSRFGSPGTCGFKGFLSEGVEAEHWSIAADMRLLLEKPPNLKYPTSWSGVSSSVLVMKLGPVLGVWSSSNSARERVIALASSLRTSNLGPVLGRYLGKRAMDDLVFLVRAIRFWA